jgi:PAS domain S-box-containing protein
MENKLCEEVINESNDAIIFRKLDGTITFWNKGATELYGWAPAEAIGKKTHSLLHTQFAPATLETTVLALENKGRWDGALFHTTKSGNLVNVESHQIFLKDKNTVLEINRNILALLTLAMNSILYISKKYSKLLKIIEARTLYNRVICSDVTTRNLLIYGKGFTFQQVSGLLTQKVKE